MAVPVPCRHEACLARLSHAQLLRLAAIGMRDSEEGRRLGDAMLAEHVPEWAVTGIFTSVDLVGALLASLLLAHSYTASVCTVWRAAWAERMNGTLRYVEQVPRLYRYVTHLTARPQGGVILPHYGGSSLDSLVRGVDGLRMGTFADMQDTIDSPTAFAFLDDKRGWVIDRDEICKIRVSDDLVLVEAVYYDLWDGWGFKPLDIAVAGDRLLVGGDGEGRGHENGGINAGVIVFGAEHGSMIYTFGERGTGPDQVSIVTSLCVHGEDVFVADTYNHRIQVYALTEETTRHVRCIGDSSHINHGSSIPGSSAAGAFNEPIGVAVARGHLIVSEREGRRIQVLTLEGGPLRAVGSPRLGNVPGGIKLGGICVDGSRLWATGPDESGTSPTSVHVYEFDDGFLA